MTTYEKIEKLQNELIKTKEKKNSLKRTTREQYSVFILLIDYYEKEIKYQKRKLQIPA